MTLTQALAHETAKIIALAEITAGVWCRAWVLNGVFVNSYTISVADEVTSVRWNRDTLLTQRASFASVNANQSSWYWDRDTQLLWVRPPTAQDIFANTVQAMVTFYLSTTIKTLNSRTYDPRLLSAPSLSRRIEAMFGDVAQVGGGQVSLANVDGYFNARQRYQWNAGSVVLKLGADTPYEEMAFADYETVATWAVEDWGRDAESFTLKLVESKSKLKSKLPNETYSRDDFPNIEDEQIGKYIPILYGQLYGIRPTLVNPGSRHFKICSHEIFELTEARIRKNFEEIKSRTPAASSWYVHATATFRYYLPDEEAKSVSYNSAAIVEADDLEDCIATANRWWAEENFVYVHPAAGNDMATGTYVIGTTKTISAWDNINFATQDLANGEFTLGDEWSIGQEVSVDLKGRAVSGAFLENSVDIVEDILTTVGATSLNAASFTAAAARLLIGERYVSQRPIYLRSVGVYIKEPKEVVEIVNEVLMQIGAFLYSNELGEFHIGVFLPEQGEGLAAITDLEIVDFGDDSRTNKMLTQVNESYAERIEDEYAQHQTASSTALRQVNDQAEPVVEDFETTFANDRHARYFAQSKLIHRGTPLKLISLRVPWTQWLRNPGEQVLVRSTRHAVDEVLEVIEARCNVTQKQVDLILGNLRGFGDTPGFWVADADVLPTRFAALAGYGSGDLTWNIDWDEEIKTWARQNVGYWTDANGFADPDDPDSFIPSVWV